MFTNHVGPLKGEEGLFSPSMEDIAYSGVSIYRIQAPKFLGFPRVLGFFGNPNTSLLMDLGPWIWVTKVGFE